MVHLISFEGINSADDAIAVCPLFSGNIRWPVSQNNFGIVACDLFLHDVPIGPAAGRPQ
jgi:hypothetical protein